MAKKRRSSKTVAKKGAAVVAVGYAWRLNSVGRAASTAAQVRTVKKDYGRVRRGAAKTYLTGKQTKYGGKSAAYIEPKVIHGFGAAKGYAQKNPGKTAAFAAGGAVVAGGAVYAYNRRKKSQASTYKRRLKNGKTITVRKGRRR